MSLFFTQGHRGVCSKVRLIAGPQGPQGPAGSSTFVRAGEILMLTNNDSGKLYIFTGNEVNIIPPNSPKNGFYIYFYSKIDAIVRIGDTTTPIYEKTTNLIYWDGINLTL